MPNRSTVDARSSEVSTSVTDRTRSPSPYPSGSPSAQNELGPADNFDVRLKTPSHIDEIVDVWWHAVQADTDSFFGGDDAESSTASLSASILEYRYSQGRTYHSTKFTSNYFCPNDEQQLESMDATHHYLTLLLDDELFLAPLKVESIHKALDIGTGSGIWAMYDSPIDSRDDLLTDLSEFGDRYPNAEVLGTDLSPCQPHWVPQNVRFEIDDAAQPWTWTENSFDFIHIRYLVGAISDWGALFREAYRCCAPGGWVQSAELDLTPRSDDGSIKSGEPVMDTCLRLFEHGGKILNNSFFVHDLQQEGFEGAGFVDVQTIDFKLPIGAWPRNPKLAEIGRFVQFTLENDLEGFTLMLWHDVVKWPKDEYQLFLVELRKALRNRKVHSYMVVRYVYGRKP